MVQTLVKMEELVTEMAKVVVATHVNVMEASLAETVKMVRLHHLLFKNILWKYILIQIEITLYTDFYF